MIKAGTRCRVLTDNMNKFKPGDIVVALDDSTVPYCCFLENYDPNKGIGGYGPSLYHPLFESELEKVSDSDRSKK